MSVLLQMIRNIDVVIYHCLNGFAGNRLLDRFASFEETNMIFRGGLFLALGGSARSAGGESPARWPPVERQRRGD